MHPHPKTTPSVNPFGRTNPAPEGVEWLEIERHPAPGGGTTYGLRQGAHHLTNGHGTLFDAINVALATLHQYDQVLAGDTALGAD